MRFVGIDVEDTRPAALHFMHRFGLAYPSIFDPKARLATWLGLFGLPTAYLVDGHACIALTLIGEQSDQRLERAVELLTAAERS